MFSLQYKRLRKISFADFKPYLPVLLIIVVYVFAIIVAVVIALLIHMLMVQSNDLISFLKEHIFTPTNILLASIGLVLVFVVQSTVLNFQMLPKVTADEAQGSDALQSQALPSSNQAQSLNNLFFSRQLIK
jgi:hypothetical protein